MDKVVENILQIDSLTPTMWRNNPLSQDIKKINNGQLNEGYYKTYPIEKVIKYVNNLFTNQLNYIGVVEKYDDYFIKVRIPKNIESSYLDKAMALCGYYAEFDGRKNENPYSKYDEIIFGQRYTDEQPNIYQQQKYLWHMSPILFKENILKYGISPRNKSEMFDYPGRVYLFKWINNKGHLLSFNELKYYANCLYGGMDFINNSKDNRYADNRKKWILYKIDVLKLPKGIKFYNDPSWIDDMAIWTYSNIPPNAIVNYNEFSIG